VAFTKHVGGAYRPRWQRRWYDLTGVSAAMITVISRWEPDPDIAAVEHRFWGQLKAFGIDRLVFVPVRPEMAQMAEQYETMEEALASTQGNRVFLESTGYKGMTDLPPRHEDVVFILGCSPTSNVRHAKLDEMYRIHEPTVTDMYPTCAGSIALAYWYGQ
jgi:hypothetical protein